VYVVGVDESRGFATLYFAIESITLCMALSIVYLKFVSLSLVVAVANVGRKPFRDDPSMAKFRAKDSSKLVNSSFLPLPFS
jgi:hypothetical protein